MIAIIDYKAGNLFSVKNAFDKLGIDSIITSDVKIIKNADKLLLPGVGAFENAMNNLRGMGLNNVIIDEIKNGKPLLGICLGMQMLFNTSEEFGLHEGLNILDGKIIHFDFDNVAKPPKIPHMGWNSLTHCKGTKLFDGLDNKQIMTNYGYDFCSAIEYNNIYATQFHPEKSGDVGLTILKRFATLV